MSKINRYIAITVLKSTALIVVLLLALQVFILFVAEFDDLGKGQFNIMQAFIYVMLRVPYEMYLFFPVGCLLGALVGLGQLAAHSELVVMRASGVSVFRITRVVLTLALLIVSTMTFFGETVIPKLSQYANQRKLLLTSKGQMLQTAGGIWLRDQQDFIYINEVLSSKMLRGVYQYHFAQDGKLELARFSEQAQKAGNSWYLQKVYQTHLTMEHTTSQFISELKWRYQIPAVLLGDNQVPPEWQSIVKLYQTMKIKQAYHLNTVMEQIAFWRRVFQPLASMVMMFLAIPFIFGPLRQSTMGARILMGITMGFGFYMLNDLFLSLSQVFALNPVISALFPTVVFFFIGWVMMRRT